jgi:hypothetical protein
MYGAALRVALVLLVAIGSLAAIPDVAGAHGSGSPVATNYLAKVSRAPAGVEASVVDGDLRLRLRASADTTVVVLDYRGAPYLRFNKAGVQVNSNSAMYYLNQTPVAETPPARLTPSTPPDWSSASSSHDYNWHDGRLHALAAIALAPGTKYVGSWSVPILVDGRRTAVSGSLWHADRPSIVWFWPIAVLLACVIAAVRVRRPALDARLARALGGTALIALAVGGLGNELHGHPNVSVLSYINLVLILAFVVWSLRQVLLRNSGYFTYFLIALAALWQGLILISTLRDGFVLIALPALVARTSAMLCLGCGAGLLLLVPRLTDQSRAKRPRDRRSTSGEAEPDQLSDAYGIG